MSVLPIRVGLDLSCVIPQPMTGVGYYAVNITKALLERRGEVEVRIFANAWQPAPPILTELARGASTSRIVRWPTRLKIEMWTRLEWPPMEWFTGPVDIVHGMFDQLPPSRTAKGLVTVYDLAMFRFSQTHTAGEVRNHQRVLSHAARRADAFVAISQNTKRDIVELLDVGEDKVHVVYAGVDLKEFARELDQDALAATKAKYGVPDLYFIHLGTLEPRKNLPRLVSAYGRVRKRFPHAPKLVLAGKKGWIYEPVFETIASLGLERDVIWTGYLEREEAIRLLRGAYAFVYPSLYEGFGLPPLEAMVSRVPVLTSNVSSLPEVVGDIGILVNPESVDEIESGLASLIEHYDDALLRLEPAYARARTFTWENSAAALAEVYRTLVS